MTRLRKGIIEIDYDKLVYQLSPRPAQGMSASDAGSELDCCDGKANIYVKVSIDPKR